MAAIASETKLSAVVQECIRKAKAGDASAQNSLGWALEEGRGIPKNARQAMEWYRKAAAQGHAVAQFNLGMMLAKGLGVAKDERQAVEWLSKAALQRHAEAQYCLGVSFAKGLGVAKDERQAAEWYRKAAAQGHAKAQYNLGVLLEEGLSAAKNEQQAVEWYHKAAVQGDASAQFNLGNMLRDGRGTPKNERQAVEWYHKAAVQGDALARNNLGNMLRDGRGIPKDERQAVEWYLKAAAQGDALAQYNLGVMLRDGRGIPKDERQAVEWYHKAAAQGDALAQYSLGVIFANGQGVAKDERQAVEWHRKAAEQGHAEAQYNLGFMLGKGLGVAKDERQGVEWYYKAAAQGLAPAQYNLGNMLVDGRGIPKDEQQAVEWFRKAAEQGDALAQFNLGVMLDNGQGVAKDERQAAEWYHKAAAQGVAGAKRELERLQLSLPTASLPSASKLRVPSPLAMPGPADYSSLTSSERGVREMAQKLKDQEELLKRFEAERNAQEALLKEQAADFAKKQAQLLEQEKKKQQEKLKEETKKQQETVTALSLTTVPRIAWKDVVIGELVGNGSYGDVYKARWQGVTVAVKQLQLKTLSAFVAKEFEHESDMMMQCQFPSIVRLYGVCTEPGHFAMVMEYLPVSLRQRLQDHKDLTWEKRWSIALDMAQGLAYLHNRGILHRDLKSLNILLDANETAKIADFGLAKVKLEVGSTSTKSHKAVGSIRWRAPELFKRSAIPTPAADVYSLGMLLWELASRQLPYSDAADEITVMGWIKDGEQEKIPDNCPKALAEIIQSCWMAPEKRPTAIEVAKGIEVAMKEAIEASRKKEQDVKAAAEKVWHFDATLKPAPKSMKDGYALIPAGDKDLKKVMEAYSHGPVPGYDIGRVQIIYNSELNRAFGGRLRLLQNRQGNPAFQPKWAQENESEWRGAIHAMFERMTAAYQDKDCPNVKLLPVWHGTKPEILSSLFKTGFASLALVDAGYFGKGIYGAYEAEYSHRVYSKGALLLNWCAVFSAYPVIDGDMLKLEGKANYANYDAHVAPVVPEDLLILILKVMFPASPDNVRIVQKL